MKIVNMMDFICPACGSRELVENRVPNDALHRTWPGTIVRQEDAVVHEAEYLIEYNEQDIDRLKQDPAYAESKVESIMCGGCNGFVAANYRDLFAYLEDQNKFKKGH